MQGLEVTSLSGTAQRWSTYYTRGALTANWSVTTPSALIARFEVLADGQVASTASRTARSAGVTLALGSHKRRIRAIHQSGEASTSSAFPVVAETTAPTFTTTPTLSLRKAPVNTTAVPVTLARQAADNTALRYVKLTAPATGTYAPTTTNRTTRSGTSTTWTMRAYDYAANTQTASISRTPVIQQETAASRYGTWTSKTSTNYLGGKSYTSSTKAPASRGPSPADPPPGSSPAPPAPDKPTSTSTAARSPPSTCGPPP